MNNTKLIKRLARIKETPVAPAWMIAAMEQRFEERARGATIDDARRLNNEVVAVVETQQRLLSIHPAWPLTSQLL